MRKYWSTLFGALPDNMEQGFQHEVARETRWIGVILAPIVMLMQLYNIYSMAFHRKGGLSTRPHQVYFTMYVALLIMAVLYLAALLWWKKNPQTRSRLFLWSATIFAACMCAWGLAITLYDQRASENVTVYVVSVLSVSVFFLLKPAHALVIFGACQVVLLSLFTVFQPEGINNTGNYINTTVMMIMAMFMSVSRYVSKRDSYQSHEVIRRQNEEILRINRELREMAITDKLSGLYNRRFLDEILPTEWEKCSRGGQYAAVIMMDIDDFKGYNDYYGHQAGDRCIEIAAETMKQCLVGCGEYLMRYGGEEFAAVLFGTEPQQALDKAESIRAAIHDLGLENKGGHQQKLLTISCGVAYCCPDTGMASRELFSQADKALYRAKAEGKDRVEKY